MSPAMERIVVAGLIALVGIVVSALLQRRLDQKEQERKTRR